MSRHVMHHGTFGHEQAERDRRREDALQALQAALIEELRSLRAAPSGS
jgi:hypothetical protein